MPPILLILACTPPVLVLLGLLWQRQKRLRQLDELLRQLDQGVLRLDGQERISWHNPAAAELLGSTGRDLRGEPLEQWLPQPSETQAHALARGSDGLQRALHLSRCGDHVLLRPAQSDAERFQRSQYFARIGT